jgi:hypothetical protein
MKLKDLKRNMKMTNNKLINDDIVISIYDGSIGIVFEEMKNRKNSYTVEILADNFYKPFKRNELIKIGNLNDEFEDCKECEGRGKWPFNLGPFPVTAVCGKCEGEGKVKVDEKIKNHQFNEQQLLNRWIATNDSDNKNKVLEKFIDLQKEINEYSKTHKGE